MAHEPLDPVLHYIRKIAGPPGAGEPTDRQLLEAFARRRDEAAFAAVVRRHAALVWGVCVRLLGHAQDAEDAFQAAFLVLARKAGRVRWREDAGNWLYAVAVRTALKARAGAVRRQRRERPMGDLEPPAQAQEPGGEELRPVLDEELSRLPEKYRAPIVLHYLEGKTYAQAARALGWAEGTVSTRLNRARALLRIRLARRGLALSAGALAAGLSGDAAAEAPAALLESTLKTVGSLGAGPGSARAVALAEEVLKVMFLSKLKNVLGVTLVVGLLGVGAALVSHNLWAAGPAENARRPPAADGPDLSGKESLRKEVDRLNRQLNTLRQKLAALEKKLDAPDGEDQGTLYKGKPARFWIRALKDRAPSYRKDAIEALGAIAEVEPQVIPVLIGALKDPDVEVRTATDAALAKLGPAARTAVPALIRQLKEAKPPPFSEEQSAAVSALYSIGPPAVPALARLLRDPDKELRLRAIQALPGGGPAAVPPLVGALKDASPEVRSQAVTTLAQMGDEARAAVPALLRALENDRQIRKEAAFALGKIRADAGRVVPALADALADEDPGFRFQVAQALEQFGPAARAAVPALERVFRSKDRHLFEEDRARTAVGNALRTIDPVAAARAGVPFTEPKYLPTLVKALHSRDRTTRVAVAEALAGIGGKGSFATGKISASVEPIIPALSAALRDDDPEVRIRAARGLGGMGPGAAAAVGALVKALRDESPEVRSAAAVALGQMRGAAKEAIPALLRARRDPKPGVAAAAAQALRRIDPGHSYPRERDDP